MIRFDINEFIKNLESKKLLLWIENRNIKYKGPKGSITKKDIHTIKQNKEDIIEYLKSREHVSKQVRRKFPLTSIQKAYLLGSNEAYELGGINTHYYMEIECPEIDLKRLNYAFNEVIKNVDAMRIIILPEGVQSVLDVVPKFHIEEIDYSSEEERLIMREKWSHYKYDLQNWPLYNMRLSHVNKLSYRIHFDFDCIIMDAWSAKMMLTKMFDIYIGESVNWTKYTFEQYCIDEKRYRKQNSEREAGEYWSDNAPKLPKAPTLPYKKLLSKIHGHSFKRISDKLSIEETKLLYNLARKNRVTPAAIICTVYMNILSKYSQNKDFSLNVTLFNRLPLHEEVSSVLGDFTNIGVIAFKNCDGDFYKEVKFVQNQLWELVRFHSFEGTKILKLINPSNIKKAILPVVFTGVLQGNRETSKFLPEGFKQGYALSQTPQVSLDYQVTDFNGGLLINWDYVSEAFENEVIKKMFFENVAMLHDLILKYGDDI